MKVDFKKKFEYETKYCLTADKARYAKFLTHYEVLKKISKIKGDIVECGVFRGTSITRFAIISRLLKIKKKIIGFDNFNNVIPVTKFGRDLKIRKKWIKDTKGGNSISVKKLTNVFKAHKIKKFQFIKGDVEKTVPKFVKNQKKLKVALLNIDIDYFESTKVCLESFYPYISRGGIILLDNYKYGYGETKFIQSFFNPKKIQSYFKERPYYIIKQS